MNGNMIVKRTGPRLTVAQQLARDPAFKGRLLSLHISTPKGNLLRAKDAIRKYPEELQEVMLQVDRERKIPVPEMLIVPGGIFTMGSKVKIHDHFYNELERPLRRVTISTFNLAKFETTNKEYFAYLLATGKDISDFQDKKDKLDHPAIVGWDEAVDYCKWLGGSQNRTFRLPTEAEGEYAASGTDGRKFPWGNDLDLSRVTFDAEGTTPVDAHPAGAGPFGHYDLAGNVWEWRSDWLAPYDPKDLIDPKGPIEKPAESDKKVIRGGSWRDKKPWDEDFLRNSCRNGISISKDNIGFRVAEDISKK